MLNEKKTMDEAAAEAHEKSINNNKAYSVCKKNENLISCNNCNDSYHFYCLKNPSLEKFLNENEWNCPKCDLIQPKKFAEIILSWRWNQISYSDSNIFPNEECRSPKESEKLTEAQILKSSKSQNHEKEFYIKWKNSTYWNCSWVSEAFIKTHFSPLLENYLAKEAKLETSSQKFYVDSNKTPQNNYGSDGNEKEIGQQSEQIIPNYHLFL